ncbi:lipoyl(octanoyl) transferase [Tremella mesenterica]|uniref:lipoyl(octanoyl) transferase n=1 Tax=Tremella mesenterica TaxID=5217 RepID=A0A4V1M2W0_TREME|nr:lipoyl(octanoyl) transferase [Tremella mesenterica]
MIKPSILPAIRYHIFRQPLPYPLGLKLQEKVIDARLGRKEKGAGVTQDIVFLLEHTPTYTTGRRDNTPNPDQLHPEEKKVQNVGAGFYITKRGGQVTYHGPGQLVGYPILDLNVMELSTRRYVDKLQRLLAEYCTNDLNLPNISAPHPDGHVGVFSSPVEKVASIGIHLRHRITSHGFSINVTPEPIKWFDLVLACGLADVHAISINQLLQRTSLTTGISARQLTVEETARSLLKVFEKAYGREIVDLSHELPGGGNEEIEELRKLVEGVEVEADRLNKDSGGWAREPSMSVEQILR